MTYALDTDLAIEQGIKATVSDGGSTQSITGAEIPTDGYMVSLGGHNGIHFDASLLGGVVGYEMTFGFVMARWSELVKPNHFLGFWIDDKTNEVWLDVSEWHTNEYYALAQARERGELAIWSVAQAREIRV